MRRRAGRYRILEKHKKLEGISCTLGKIAHNLYGKEYVNALHACRDRINAIEVDRLRVKLIESLMRIAVEHAGTERGLLILLRGAEQQIEAEATTAEGRIEVTLGQAPVTASELPESMLQYLIRASESVILDDAVRNLFSEDHYVREKRPKSIFCLPVVVSTVNVPLN
jgi:GAF domain-containing protein